MVRQFRDLHELAIRRTPRDPQAMFGESPLVQAVEFVAMTMALGDRGRVYGATTITERHRHRYEFNCLYERTLAEHGLRISGRSPDSKFVEIAELPNHPWYLAVQFHPEFKSKPTRPHPLFGAFVDAAYRHKMSGAGVSRPATESVA